MLMLILMTFLTCCFFFFNDTATTEIYTLSLHDALPIYTRLIRGEMLRVRETEYAEAARTVGNRPRQVMLVHLFPNCVPPLIVQATLAMGFEIGRAHV